MAVSRAIVGLIALLAVLATLWFTMLGAGGAGAGSRSLGHLPSGAAATAQGYGSAIRGAQSAVQQANVDAQRPAGTAAGTP